MKCSSKIRSTSLDFEALPEWLTVKEVRTYLRLSRSSVYDMIRAGSIPNRRFGRQFRIAKAALRPD